MYPDYVYTANAYEFMAEADLAKGNKQAAAASADAITKRAAGAIPQRSRNWRPSKRKLGDPADAAATLDRINYIYPVNDEDLHRHLGDLWFAQKNYAGAHPRIHTPWSPCTRSTRPPRNSIWPAPISPRASGTRPRSTSWHRSKPRPAYRPAQKLLLQLEDSEKGK